MNGAEWTSASFWRKPSKIMKAVYVIRLLLMKYSSWSIFQLSKGKWFLGPFFGQQSITGPTSITTCNLWWRKRKILWWLTTASVSVSTYTDKGDKRWYIERNPCITNYIYDLQGILRMYQMPCFGLEEYWVSINPRIAFWEQEVKAKQLPKCVGLWYYHLSTLLKGDLDCPEDIGNALPLLPSEPQARHP